MSNAFIQLRHFAAEIESGTTQRVECPWCGGGNSREKCFAVTRTSEAEALYKCHRASCGHSGRIAVWGFKLRQISDGGGTSGGELSNSSSNERKQFTPRLYSCDTHELGEEWAQELLGTYDIKLDEANWVGWRVESHSGNLVCPVRSPLGVVRGVEVRRSKIQVPIVPSPKTDPYRFLDEPWMGWYRRITSGPIVFVEDAISALKVSRHFQVACLHGSHLHQEMLLEAIEIAGVKEELIIALDRDATTKAIKFVAQYRFLAPNFRAVPLSKDLKYSTDEEIVQILKR
jgi:hypothetical protein